jgi:RNA polymerase sigma-70 factor (ECF subfamily)
MYSPKDSDELPPAEVLASLYEEHGRLVLAAAFRVTGSRQDAEDVLQTVFLRLMRRWDHLELGEAAGAYLHRAAVNGSLDLLRSRARGGPLPLDDLAEELSDAGGVSAERLAQAGEVRRGLREALLEMSEKSARVFVLRYIEGLPNKDIANLLGMRRVAVAVMLHRTRKQLQSKLQQFLEGGPS